MDIATLPQAEPQKTPRFIRQACRHAFFERLAILGDIADDDTEKTLARVKALELLAKVGVGFQHEHHVEGAVGVVHLPALDPRLPQVGPANEASLREAVARALPAPQVDDDDGESEDEEAA